MWQFLRLLLGADVAVLSEYSGIQPKYWPTAEKVSTCAKTLRINSHSHRLNWCGYVMTMSVQSNQHSRYTEPSGCRGISSNVLCNPFHSILVFLYIYLCMYIILSTVSSTLHLSCLSFFCLIKWPQQSLHKRDYLSSGDNKISKW